MSGGNTLQADLDALLEWSDQQQLPFNWEKCKTLHLGHHTENHVYRTGDTQLVQTMVERDLRIQVDCQLKFREQAAAAVSRASHILATFINLCASRQDHTAATIPDHGRTPSEVTM